MRPYMVIRERTVDGGENGQADVVDREVLDSLRIRGSVRASLRGRDLGFLTAFHMAKPVFYFRNTVHIW